MVPGPWTLNAGTNPNTIERVLTIALAEMRRMRDKKVKSSELEDNQRYFTGVMPLQMETNEGIAGQIINMIRYKRGLDYLLTYPERVHAVTVRDIQAVAQKWLDPDNFVLVTAGAVNCSQPVSISCISRGSKTRSRGMATAFCGALYTAAEIAYCNGRRPELAARFAAKEAACKGAGRGPAHLERAGHRLARCRS